MKWYSTLINKDNAWDSVLWKCKDFYRIIPPQCGGHHVATPLSGGNNSTVCPHAPLPPNSTIHSLKHLILEQHSRERPPCSLCALRGWFLSINCKDGSPSTWPHQGDIGTADRRTKYHPCRLATVQYCTDEPWILVRTWDSNWHKPSAKTTL